MTAPEPRVAAGLRQLARVDGRAFAGIAERPDELGRLVVEFVFGDVYARPALTLRDRELAAVAALAALGGRERQLDAHLRAARSAGVSDAELEELAIQTAVFAGFPAALNAMDRVAALRERPADT